MYVFVAALLTAAAWSDAPSAEPSEDAMRKAFAADLSQGVRSALAFVAGTAGPQGLARIRAAHTDEFEIRVFRKGKCRPSLGSPGHVCDFAVEIDTVAGPMTGSLVGRFYVSPHGLMFDRAVSDEG